MVTLNLRKKYRELKIPFSTADAALRAGAALLDDSNIQLHTIVDDAGKVIFGAEDIRSAAIDLALTQPKGKKKGKKRA